MLAQMQELLVHLVCSDSVLQAWNNTTQMSHPCDLSASINHLLRRNIWEALYHRLGVPVLGMFLQTEVAQGKLSDMSHTWNENIRTHAGALVVTNYDKVT